MMKRVMKTMATALIALMLMLAAVPVMAKDYAVTEDKRVQLYLPEKATATSYPDRGHLGKEYPERGRYTYFLGNLYSSDGEPIKNIKITAKSSNNKVATVKLEKDNDGTAFISVEPKKAGVTTIKVTVNGKIYQTKYTVKKYINPVSSIKVGKTNIKGASFNKTGVYTLKYSQYANKKMNVKINLKKGWKLQWGVEYAQKSWAKYDGIKNGAALKISGGKGFVINAMVKNTKTGQEEEVAVYFK